MTAEHWDFATKQRDFFKHLFPVKHGGLNHQQHQQAKKQLQIHHFGEFVPKKNPCDDTVLGGYLCLKTSPEGGPQSGDRLAVTSAQLVPDASLNSLGPAEFVEPSGAKKMESGRISVEPYPWRIHGAAMYGNMTGVNWWDPCYHI